MLNERSSVRLRVPDTRIRELLPLAGKALELDGHKLRVGVPHILPLTPAPTLRADVVLIKIAHANGNPITPEAFLVAARRKLAELGMGVKVEAGIPLATSGKNAGEPQRKVVKVKDQTHVGFPLMVQGLTAEESIKLQEHGMGGRRLMGCGLFVPMGGATSDV
jgi:CRISPR-associated endonuclease/helicase Cas3